MLVEVLHQLGKPYYGCNPKGARYTSKLLFKEALRSNNMETPAWVILPSSPTTSTLPFDLPCSLRRNTHVTVKASDARVGTKVYLLVSKTSLKNSLIEFSSSRVRVLGN